MKDEEMNESSIDGLITYSENDSPDTEIIPAPESEFDAEPFYEESQDTETADIVSETDDEYADDDYIESDYDEDAEYEGSEYDEYDGVTYDDDDTEYFDMPDDENASDGAKRKIKRLIVIASLVLGMTAVAAFISIDTGIIGAYKTNFAKNFTRLFGHLFTQNQTAVNEDTPSADENYNTNIQNSITVSPAGIMNAQIAPYKDGVVCASANYLAYVDASGSMVWEINTVIAEPLLSVHGSYILIAENGRNKICLYNDKSPVYETDDSDNIVSVRVSPTGDAVLVTNKASYKGGISVYNKSGEQIYSWASGSDAVISADISSPSRKIAVSLLNTEAKAKSVIQLFDINEAQSFAQINVENAVMFNLRFTGNTLSAFGDNRLVVLSDSGKVISDNSLEEVQLTHSAMDGSGEKILSFDDGTVPMLRIYDSNGSEQFNAKIRGIPDFIDVEGKTVLYNIGRDIYCGRISIGNMTKYTAAMDIKKLILISQNTFAIVYSNSIEFVKI